MKHLFIPYELAVIAKEKRFNEPCIGCYDEKGVFGLTIMSIKEYYINSKEDYYNCGAPLYQQIVDWFREKKNLFISIEYTDEILGYKSKITDLYNNEEVFESNWSVLYYTALNKAIEEAFKLIKDKNESSL